MQSEQVAFSLRLKELLAIQRIEESPTQLQRLFNAAWQGKPVTCHAVRKWLMGDSMPTQAKMVTLAHMLNADAHWLRYGGEIEVTEDEACSRERHLMYVFRRLNPSQKEAILNIATVMVAS